jgi:hypothetical protein
MVTCAYATERHTAKTQTCTSQRYMNNGTASDCMEKMISTTEWDQGEGASTMLQNALRWGVQTNIPSKIQ